MAKSIFLIGLLLFSLACNLKEKKENAYVITDTYNDIAKKYAAIRHQGDTGPVNLTNLKDSGTAINGIKDGLWREYAIDSTQYDSSAKPPRELYIKEEIGSYIKGKRNGAWFTYVSFKNGSSFGKWGLYRECKYWNGLKDSLEVLFFTHSGDTESIRDYKQGEWEGKFIRYYRNYVVKLVGYAHKNKVRIEKSYYNDKQIRYLNTDTLINKVEHRFFRMYSDSCTLQQIGKHGNLIETAFGINDSIFDGPRTRYYSDGNIRLVVLYVMGKKDTEKFYFRNKHLWTTWIFKDGLIWNVLNDYNEKGDKVDHGTLKNGYGTLKRYKADGTLYKIETYKDGKKVSEIIKS